MRKFTMLLSGIFFFAMTVLGQTRTITGRVTDDMGNPIQNASVLLKGSNEGVSTDAEGNFSLQVPSSVTSIIVSFIGMGDKEIALTEAVSYNVTMTTAATDLQDVVVVGYGTQKRANMASAISTIKAPELENRPFTSVDQMFQGKVAGLQAPFLSGQPGAAQEIRIRGIGSVSAGANPLFVIDGIITNTGDLSNNTTTANAMAGINPNDIETITVLKDAQATSIYGSRGSNGVIMITTKKGRTGKTRFRVDAEGGFNEMAPLPDKGRFLNAEEWIGLLEEGIVNAGGSPVDVEEIATYYGKGSGVNTDWLDLVTRRGSQQQYNVSASGGDEKNQFFVSGGYFKQEGVVIASDFTRYSFRANYKHIASDRFNFNIIASGSNFLQNTPSNGGSFSNPVGASGFLRPTQNPYNEDGTYNINTDDNVTGNGNVYNGNYNPLFIAENDRYNLTQSLIQSSVSAEYSILKNLKYTGRFGIDYNNLEEYSFWNQFHGDGVSYQGIGFPLYTRHFNWIATNQMDYNTVLGNSGIRLDAKLGYEAQKSKGYFIVAAKQGFPPNSGLYLTTNAATPVQADASASDYDLAGLYSAVSLNLDDKYILNGSFRRDGSSRFSSGNRYGNFWSVGAAWNIDKEEFLSGTSFISYLKLRGSYGTTGNADIGNYAWRQQVRFNTSYAGQPGGVFNVVGNQNLTWESTRQANIGLDAGFLDNRIGLTVDVYRRVSDNLLFLNPLSATTGFESFTDNIGELENKGIEIALNTTPVRTNNFTWELNFNISHNKNKVLSLPGGKDIIATGGFILREGYDYRTFYAREWAGVDTETGDPLWYVDETHEETTNNYNNATRQLLGSASPDFFGGLTNIFSFRSFDLQADFVYNYGNYVRDQWIFYTMDGGDPSSNKRSLILERWQKPGDITNVPKYVYGSTSNSSAFSSRFLNKGDYIKLRNLTFGYNLKNGLEKIGISTLRIYVRGTNLLTKTYDDNLTIDPEQGVDGGNNFDAFYPRTYTVGINVGF